MRWRCTRTAGSTRGQPHQYPHRRLHLLLQSCCVLGPPPHSAAFLQVPPALAAPAEQERGWEPQEDPPPRPPPVLTDPQTQLEPGRQKLRDSQAFSRFWTVESRTGRGVPTLQGEPPPPPPPLGAGGPERTPAEVVTLFSWGRNSPWLPPRASTDTTVNLDSQQGAASFGAGLGPSPALQNVKRTHARARPGVCLFKTLVLELFKPPHRPSECIFTVFWMII